MFHQALQNQDHIPFLYSTTPPRADIAPERLESTVARLGRRAQTLRPSGVVVYDVQEERDRNAAPRPFPFQPMMETQAYVRRLRETVNSPLIAYKCIAGLSEGEWKCWLRGAGAAGVEAVSVVGLASSHIAREGITLPRALEIAADCAPQLALGGVVIPERHTPERSECNRLLRKTALGCTYFISQAIYDPDLTIQLLRDYARTCNATGAAPQRIFLTFTPCGSEKTLEFMRWLGVQIPDAAAGRILASGAPLAESVDICVENFRRILDAVSGLSIPLGVNVESVSSKKEEIDCAVALHHALSNEAQESQRALHRDVIAQKP